MNATTNIKYVSFFILSYFNFGCFLFQFFVRNRFFAFTFRCCWLFSKKRSAIYFFSSAKLLLEGKW